MHYCNISAVWANLSNFSWMQGNGNQFAGTVLIDINRLLSFDNQESRIVTVDEYEHSVSGQLKERIADGQMTLQSSTAGSGFLRNFQLDVAGRVTTDAGIAVQVTTDATLSATQTPAESPDAAEPFSGQLSMVADDGGRLVMTAQPTVSFGPKLVDIVFTRSEGETLNLEGEAFPELTIMAP